MASLLGILWEVELGQPALASFLDQNWLEGIPRPAPARHFAAVLARLRRWDVDSAARVDLFLANSRFVAERIRRYYGRGSTVLPPPVDTESFSPGAAVERTYVLVVAALAPYKKVDLAVHACERLGLPLRIVGEGPEAPRLRALAAPGVRFLGRVDSAELRQLYRGAICLLQPGIEDFGIAAAEALACGTPVVALGTGGVLDIVEDGRHGVLFAEVDAEAIAAAVDKSRRIEFNSMEMRGRAERFSVPRFREGLRSILLGRWPYLEGEFA